MNLNQITAKPESCKQLYLRGIEVPAFFWHVKEDDKTKEPDASGKYPQKDAVYQFKTPVPGPDMIPAWTKEELDVMIGPDLPKPDLYSETLKSKATDPESYPVLLPGKMLVFKSGATASAEALIFLIDNDHVKVEDAIARHKKLFKF